MKEELKAVIEELKTLQKWEFDSDMYGHVCGEHDETGNWVYRDDVEEIVTKLEIILNK